jgi:hypothetical protein
MIKEEFYESACNSCFIGLECVQVAGIEAQFLGFS